MVIPELGYHFVINFKSSYKFVVNVIIMEYVYRGGTYKNKVV